MIKQRLNQLVYPPVRGPAGVVFFDDFIGAAYDSRTWSNNGGTVFMANMTQGGWLQYSAVGTLTWGTTSSVYGSFSAAKNGFLEVRAQMAPGSGTSRIMWYANTTNYVAWQRVSGSAYFQVYASNDSGGMGAVTSIAGDANTHRFQIQLTTGRANFFLDDVSVGSMSTNIPTVLLAPAAQQTHSAGYNYLDYVLAIGDF